MHSMRGCPRCKELGESLEKLIVKYWVAADNHQRLAATDTALLATLFALVLWQQNPKPAVVTPMQTADSIGVKS
jgi:hypothetical protein